MNASPAVLLKLIHSHGVQNLLYGISAISLTGCELKSLSHVYDSMYCKIFRTYDSNIIANCQYYSGHLSFPILFELQRYIFLINLLSTSVIDDRSKIDRIDYREHSALKAKYKFEDNQLNTHDIY